MRRIFLAIILLFSLTIGTVAFASGEKTVDVSMLRKAAEQGDPVAQNKLGFLYQNGDGVSQDDGEAVKWFRRAADQGHRTAQDSLGSYYVSGVVVPRNYVLGYMWESLAAAQGLTNLTKVLNELEQRMTKDEVAEAQRLAHEWKPKPETPPAPH